MATPKVLDEQRFEARARIGDVVALGLVLVIGAALLFDMYSLGHSAMRAASEGGGEVFLRDRAFVNAMIETALVVMALAWITYRLFARAHRRSGG